MSLLATAAPPYCLVYARRSRRSQPNSKLSFYLINENSLNVYGFRFLCLTLKIKRTENAGTGIVYTFYLVRYVRFVRCDEE